jgi:hypothetical protein
MTAQSVRESMDPLNLSGATTIFMVSMYGKTKGKGV